MATVETLDEQRPTTLDGREQGTYVVPNDWADARHANLEWLRKLTPEQRSHVMIHPRYGEISVDTYVAEWAYHDLDHLRQILSVLSADLYPHIGPFQTLYTRPS